MYWSRIVSYMLLKIFVIFLPFFYWRRCWFTPERPSALASIKCCARLVWFLFAFRAIILIITWLITISWSYLCFFCFLFFSLCFCISRSLASSWFYRSSQWDTRFWFSLNKAEISDFISFLFCPSNYSCYFIFVTC